MQNLYVQKSQLSGTLALPASKSHTMRALIFATLAEGTSVIHNPLPSPDTDAMIMACQQFGASITHTNNQLTVIGTSGNLKTLVKLSQYRLEENQPILAPVDNDESLREAISQYRVEGYSIIEALDADDYAAQAPYFEKMLVKDNGKWTVKTK